MLSKLELGQTKLTLTHTSGSVFLVWIQFTEMKTKGSKFIPWGAVIIT